jgi:hypothetical protein
MPTFSASHLREGIGIVILAYLSIATCEKIRLSLSVLALLHLKRKNDGV